MSPPAVVPSAVTPPGVWLPSASRLVTRCAFAASIHEPSARAGEGFSMRRPAQLGSP